MPSSIVSRLQSDRRSLVSQLRRRVASAAADPAIVSSVADILAAVESGGMKAALELTERFDRAKLTPARVHVSKKELQEGVKSLSASDRRAIREAVACVEAFHKQSKPTNWTAKNPHGATVGERFYPLRRVGIYIPGGSVPLVSTAVMTITLARMAGVPEIAVFTPPRPDGSVDPGLLAGVFLSGGREVYRIGGAQAVGVMAFGVGKIEAVDKIFGPGNAYVTEAKRQVFGQVGIDLLPGPSEAFCIADESARADYCAADLIAQAEHGSGREKVYFVTTETRLLDEVSAEIARQLPALSHAEKIRQVLKERSYLMLAKDWEEVIQVTNFVAPEHLELHVAPALQKRLLKEITTAGAILVGHETPTVLGDFTAGPSHVLPTDRAGRFLSGLRLEDFCRRSSVVKYNRRQLAAAAPVVETLSRLEQLDAHGRSLAIRLERP